METQAFFLPGHLKTDFHVATGMCFEFLKDNQVNCCKNRIAQNVKNILLHQFLFVSVKEKRLYLNKYVSVLSSLNNPKDKLA